VVRQAYIHTSRANCTWVLYSFTNLSEKYNALDESTPSSYTIWRCLIFKIFFLVTIWCEPRDHVVTQPTIKIEIWSWKAEIGLIGVWHNGYLPQGTNTIGLSRMMPRNQLIFDKSDSVRSRTEECKNHSHTLKLKNSEVIIIKAVKILAYMSLNSSWKINPNRPLMWTYMRFTQNWPKTLNWKAHNLIQTSLGS
jgi:hypothetical protein